MAWISFTCKCGHTDDFMAFCRTAVFGDLPPGHYQCPACHYAWRRRETDHRILRAGTEATIIPGRVELVPVEARL